MNTEDIKTNLTHIVVGALMVLPFFMLFNYPVLAMFITWSMWGVFREHAETNDQGKPLFENWVPHMWNTRKLIESITWGVGGALGVSIIKLIHRL